MKISGKETLGKSRYDHGFTLLEILVVVLIITILATIVGVNIATEPGKARSAAAKAQIRQFKTALQLYRMHHGRLPTQRQGLDALCRRPDDARDMTNYPEEGYLESEELPLDPWGREYVYMIPGSGDSSWEVVTYGADGEPGGEGEDSDITSRKLD